MTYWLLKTEPTEYGYADLERDGRGRWDGVRGWQALRNIGRMRAGDLAFIYHSGKERAIIGIAEVTAPPYPDPQADDPRLLVFDLRPHSALRRPVSLQEIKALPELRDWELVRQPRLSVMPVPEFAWRTVLARGNP